MRFGSLAIKCFMFVHEVLEYNFGQRSTAFSCANCSTCMYYGSSAVVENPGLISTTISFQSNCFYTLSEHEYIYIYVYFLDLHVGHVGGETRKNIRHQPIGRATLPGVPERFVPSQYIIRPSSATAVRLDYDS